MPCIIISTPRLPRRLLMGYYVGNRRVTSPPHNITDPGNVARNGNNDASNSSSRNGTVLRGWDDGEVGGKVDDGLGGSAASSVSWGGSDAKGGSSALAMEGLEVVVCQELVVETKFAYKVLQWRRRALWSCSTVVRCDSVTMVQHE